MVDVLLQHLFECQAGAVFIRPDFSAAWFPLMHHVCLEIMKIEDPGEQSVLVRDHHLQGEQQPFVYHQWGMVAARLDFANKWFPSIPEHALVTPNGG